MNRCAQLFACPTPRLAVPNAELNMLVLPEAFEIFAPKKYSAADHATTSAYTASVIPGTTVATTSAIAVAAAMMTPSRRPKYQAVNAPTMRAGITVSF